MTENGKFDLYDVWVYSVIALVPVFLLVATLWFLVHW
jgi:hypothetical protein